MTKPPHAKPLPVNPAACPPERERHIPSPTPEALIDRYCEAWSAPLASERAQALAEVWAPGATYLDPTVSVNGVEALLRHIDVVRAQYPGARIERTSRVDLHHGVARFTWQLAQVDGKRLPESLDIATLTSDGAQIAAIVGFFGPTRPR